MKTAVIPLLALLIAVSASAKPPADLQKKLDDFVKGGPGGVAVAWVDADGTTYFSSGTMAAADPRAITPDSEFEIGSVSKVFTALLLVESERLGKVSRNDAAAKYLLPAADPAQATLAKITLLSLTTHTSGLPRLPSNLGLTPGDNDPYARYDDAKLIAALRTDGAVATPGRSAVYSNFGVAVLGEALAAAWGTSYAEALSAHVLTPLGMKATSVGLAGQPPPANLAPGHVAGQVVPNWTFQAVAPAGALRSSARDMARFLAACLAKSDGPLHSAIEATLQPQTPSAETGGHLGLAWILTDDADLPIAWHNGATAGSHAFVAFSRKTGAGVVILSNIQQPSEALGFSLLGAKPQGPTVEPVKNAADYVGYYALNPAVGFAILEVKGALRVKLGQQPSLALHPLSPDRFSVVGAPAEISFERDPAGKVIALVLHQNGVDQRAPRGEPPPPPKEVVLPVETLREYAGHYPLAPTFVLTVTEEGGSLFVQATGQGKAPVFASAKDDFFYKVVAARITFQRDAAGKVTGLALHQNGRDMPAPKSAE
jgi:CubicO group peptidase (beta-lactamase class C family)